MHAQQCLCSRCISWQEGVSYHLQCYGETTFLDKMFWGHAESQVSGDLFTVSNNLYFLISWNTNKKVKTWDIYHSTNPDLGSKTNLLNTDRVSHCLEGYNILKTYRM